MSQEFEKTVLDKLNRIDTKLDEHTSILNEHTEEFKKVNKTLDEHTKILDEHTENFKILNKDVYHIKNKIIKIDENLEDIKEVFEFNQQNFDKLKKESKKDIDTVFSALNRVDSRLNIKDGVTESLKAKNFKLETRVSNLEDKFESIQITA